MKKFGNLIACITMIVTAILMTGCGNKEAISSSEFKSIMGSKGYDVQDATSQFSAYDYVKQVYIALNDEYQIEFYELSDEDKAVSFFETNKTIFEDSKSSTSSQVSTSIGNHSKYALSSDESYKVVSRIDNTVIYLNVDEEYKDEVKDLLEDLGY